MINDREREREKTLFFFIEFVFCLISSRILIRKSKKEEYFNNQVFVSLRINKKKKTQIEKQRIKKVHNIVNFKTLLT